MSGYDRIQTKYGDVRISPSSASHVYINAGVDASSGLTGLVIRGVTYHATLHLALYDGVWDLLREPGAASPSWNALYMRRADRWVNDHPSPSAREAAIAELLRAGREWAAANQKAIDRAQQDHVRSEIQSRREKIRTHEKEIATLRAEITKLEKEVR